MGKEGESGENKRGEGRTYRAELGGEVGMPLLLFLYVDAKPPLLCTDLFKNTEIVGWSRTRSVG